MFPCVADELLYCISLNKRCGVSHPYSGFVSWGLLGIKVYHLKLLGECIRELRDLDIYNIACTTTTLNVYKRVNTRNWDVNNCVFVVCTCR